MKTSSKCILSVPMLVAGSIALSGCGGRSASNPTTITYHQIGICKNYATPTGTEASKPNEAFAVYKIEAVDNTKTSSVLNLDPGRMHVDQTGAEVKTQNISFQIRRFILPDPRFGQVLGLKTLGWNAVPANGKLDIDAIVVIPLDISTTAGGSATNPNSYDLVYDTTTTEVQTGSKDIVLVRTNTADTKFPMVENCKDLAFK